MKKINIAITVLSIAVVVVLIGLIAFALVFNNAERGKESYKYSEQIQTDGESSEDATEKVTESDETPDVPDIPDTNKNTGAVTDNKDKPDIDITDMGRNPNAEVVGVEIEYEKKEIG